jgi:hypothetical protein
MANTDVTKMAFFAVTDPKLITIDFEDLAKRHKERIAEREKTNPPKSEPAEVELRHLRGQLFRLQEWVKNAEIYANNKAGTVENLSERLAKALNKKKTYAEAGNLLAERAAEHGIQLLESELADAKREYHFAKQQSANATRALNGFDGCERIAVLTQKPLPDAKSAHSGPK